MEAIDRPGVWRRAAMTAVVAWLNLAEAMASLPSGLDHDLARRLFVAAEIPFMNAWHEVHTKKTD